MIPAPKTRAEMEEVMLTHEMIVRKKPCVDCAFNKRSPENQDGSGPCGSGLTLVELLQERIEAHDVMPFFCHEGMECAEGDGWREVVGIPDDAVLQICHGWNERFQAEYRKWKERRDVAGRGE